MTPPFESSEPRRSFVKKTLATSVSISFAGLIRASGEEGGGTTTIATTIGTEATTQMTTVPTTIGEEETTTSPPSTAENFMCASSPEDSETHTNDIPQPSGGKLRLVFKDTGCFKKSTCHHVQSITSTITVSAEAIDIPDNAGAPWIIKTNTTGSNEGIEENTFEIDSSGAISRTNDSGMAIKVHTRDLSWTNAQGVVVPFFFKLEILGVERTETSVKVVARAWLEGNYHGHQYSKSNAGAGFNVSQVVQNGQPPHTWQECGVQSE